MELDMNEKISLSLSFESINLPPFRDILIFSKNSNSSVLNISKSIALMSSDNFGLIEIDHENIEAVLINKKILRKIDQDQMIKILKQRIFPYIDKGEIIKVDLNLKISIDNIEC